MEICQQTTTFKLSKNMTPFLKYQIRNIDGKPELFDENGEQGWTSKVIHQDANIYFTKWGGF